MEAVLRQTFREEMIVEEPERHLHFEVSTFDCPENCISSSLHLGKNIREI